MTEKRQLPDLNRVSVLTAVILLAYALVRVIALPIFRLETQLVGRQLTLSIDFNVIVAFIIAGLTATGMDWLLRGHPAFQGAAVQHWLLPALTAWVLNVPLSALPDGLIWWAAFGLGGILMVLVFLAEYVAVDPSDARYAVATVGLTSLSFALFLILTVALRFTGIRFFLQLPAILVAAGLVSLRTMHLRMGGRWEYGWMIGIVLTVVQLAAALHYLPLTPVTFGLVLLAPVYALTTFAVNLNEGMTQNRAFFEVGITVSFLWVLAFWVR